MNSSRPIVALDIDGTLGDYHSWFLQFAEMYLGKPMPPAHENTSGVPLYKWMGVSKSTYRQVKLAYRRGSLKRGMPCYPGASELTRSLRRRGAAIFICTTRPYLSLEMIDADTRHWLRRNSIQYDEVLWGEHKYRDLVRAIDRERVVAVMDDLPEMTRQAVDCGVRHVLLRDQPYNQGVQMYDERVHDMQQAEELLCGYLQQWKDKRHARV